MKELVDGVPVKEADEDELAKRFDLLCYGLQWELVTKKGVLPKPVADVQELAGKLSKKGSIPAVFDKMPLIKDVQTKAWWKDVNLMKMEGLRKDLRHLIHFIDREDSRVVYINFRDESVDTGVDEPASVYLINGNLEACRNRVS